MPTVEDRVQELLARKRARELAQSASSPSALRRPEGPISGTRFAGESLKVAALGAVENLARSARNYMGDDPTRTTTLERALIEYPASVSQDYMERYAQEGQPTKTLAESMASIGYSLASIPPAIAGAAAGTGAAGPVGGVPGAMAGAGAVMFGATRDAKLEEFYDYENADYMRRTGKPLTKERFDRIAKKKGYYSTANKYAIAEAAPEAIGEVLGYRALRTGGKVAAGLAKVVGKQIIPKTTQRIGARLAQEAGERILTSTGKTIGKELASKAAPSFAMRVGRGALGFTEAQAIEQATETFTGWQQSKLDADVYGTPALDIYESFKSQAPVTATTTGILGMFGLGGGKAYDIMTRNKINAMKPEDVAKIAPDIISNFKVVINNEGSQSPSAQRARALYSNHESIVRRMDEIVDNKADFDAAVTDDELIASLENQSKIDGEKAVATSKEMRTMLTEADKRVELATKLVDYETRQETVRQEKAVAAAKAEEFRVQKERENFTRAKDHIVNRLATGYTTVDAQAKRIETEPDAIKAVVQAAIDEYSAQLDEVSNALTTLGVAIPDKTSNESVRGALVQAVSAMDYKLRTGSLTYEAAERAINAVSSIQNKTILNTTISGRKTNLLDALTRTYRDVRFDNHKMKLDKLNLLPTKRIVKKMTTDDIYSLVNYYKYAYAQGVIDVEDIQFAAQKFAGARVMDKKLGAPVSNEIAAAIQGEIDSGTFSVPRDQVVYDTPEGAPDIYKADETGETAEAAETGEVTPEPAPEPTSVSIETDDGGVTQINFEDLTPEQQAAVLALAKGQETDVAAEEQVAETAEETPAEVVEEVKPAPEPVSVVEPAPAPEPVPVSAPVTKGEAAKTKSVAKEKAKRPKTSKVAKVMTPEPAPVVTPAITPVVETAVVETVADETPAPTLVAPTPTPASLSPVGTSIRNDLIKRNVTINDVNETDTSLDISVKASDIPMTRSLVGTIIANNDYAKPVRVNGDVVNKVSATPETVVEETVAPETTSKTAGTSVKRSDLSSDDLAGMLKKYKHTVEYALGENIYRINDPSAGEYNGLSIRLPHNLFKKEYSVYDTGVDSAVTPEVVGEKTPAATKPKKAPTPVTPVTPTTPAPLDRIIAKYFEDAPSVDAIRKDYGLEQDQATHIIKSVHRLGTKKAVNAKYHGDSAVDKFAREMVGPVLEGKEPRTIEKAAKEVAPEVAPEITSEVETVVETDVTPEPTPEPETTPEPTPKKSKRRIIKDISTAASTPVDQDTVVSSVVPSVPVREYPSGIESTQLQLALDKVNAIIEDIDTDATIRKQPVETNPRRIPYTNAIDALKSANVNKAVNILKQAGHPDVANIITESMNDETTAAWVNANKLKPSKPINIDELANAPVNVKDKTWEPIEETSALENRDTEQTPHSMYRAVVSSIIDNKATEFIRTNFKSSPKLRRTIVEFIRDRIGDTDFQYSSNIDEHARLAKYYAANPSEMSFETFQYAVKQLSTYVRNQRDVLTNYIQQGIKIPDEVTAAYREYQTVSDLNVADGIDPTARNPRMKLEQDLRSKYIRLFNEQQEGVTFTEDVAHKSAEDHIDDARIAFETMLGGSARSSIFGARKPRTDAEARDTRVDSAPTYSPSDLRQGSSGSEQYSAQRGVFSPETTSLSDVKRLFKWADSVEQLGDGTFEITHKGNVLRIYTVDKIVINERELYAFAASHGITVEEARANPPSAAYHNGEIKLVQHEADTFTLAHESYHWLEDIGYLTKGDIIVINQAAREYYNRHAEEGQDRTRAIDQEKRATFIEHALLGRETERQSSTFARIVQKVRDIIQSFVDLAKMSFGITDTRSITTVLSEFESGKLFERGSVAERENIPHMPVRYSGGLLGEQRKPGELPDEMLDRLLDDITTRKLSGKQRAQFKKAYYEDEARAKLGIDKTNAYRDDVTPYERVSMDSFITRVFNSMHPVKYYQKIIHRGDTSPIEQDSHTAWENSVGIAGEKIKQLGRWIGIGSITERESQKNSFIARLKDAGFDMTQLDEVLYANHAVERNNWIQEMRAAKGMDKETGDIIENHLGSGMEDADANDILAKADPRLIEMAEEFRREVVDKQLDVMLEHGLLSKSSVEMFRSRWKHYVPLKGWQSEITSLSTELTFADTIMRGVAVTLDPQERNAMVANAGRGWTASGVEFKEAKGRHKGSLARPISVQAIQDAQRTIVRAEKNTAAQSFLRMVLENPSNAWRVIDDKSSAMNAANTIEVKVDGRPTYIELADERLANAIKDVGVQRGWKILYLVNSLIRNTSTVYNPQFMLTNFERDIQTAIVHLYGEKNAEGKVGKIIGDTKNAIAGMYRYESGSTKADEWTQWAERFSLAGAKTGWAFMQDITSINKEIISSTKQFERGGKNASLPKHLVAKLGSLVENANTAVENGVRLSTFKNLVESGVDERTAANIAKNLTVNFNRHGQIGPWMNSLWLFSGAGLQGTFQMFRMLGVRSIFDKVKAGVTERSFEAMTKTAPLTKWQKRAWKVAMGMVAMSFGQAIMNMMVAGDDYDQFSDYNKDDYWLCMLPNGKSLAFKVPYGYNIFHVAGNVMAEAMMGKATLPQAGVRVIEGFGNAFNPFGSGSALQVLSPTATDWFVQLKENKNFFGGPIRPVLASYEKERPASQLYFASATGASKAFTAWVNRMTGGSDPVYKRDGSVYSYGEKGYISQSPEDLDHMVEFLLGGIGKLFTQTYSAAGDYFSTGDFPPVNNVPFVKQVLREPDEWTAQTKVYNFAKSSSMRVYGPKELEQFYKAVIYSVKQGTIPRGDAIKIVREFKDEQRKLKRAVLVAKARG